MALKLIMAALASVSVKQGFNPRFDYGEIDELTKSFENNGVSSMQPLRVVETSKDKYELIDGHRRLAGIQGMTTKPETIQVLVESKVKNGEADIMAFTLNNNKPLTPWEQAEVVSRLSGLNYKQSKIANKLGIDPVRVSRLALLADMPDWVQEAGLQGKLSATLVLSLYDEQKGKGQEKFDGTVKALETKKTEIELNGITAKSFSFAVKELTPEQREQVEKEKAILQEKTAQEERVKSASGTYTKAYESLSKIIGNISAENRKQFSDLLAGIKSPTDGTTPENIVAAYATATEEVAALTSAVNEWIGAQVKLNGDKVNADLLQAQHDAQAKGQAALASLPVSTPTQEASNPSITKPIADTPSTPTAEISASAPTPTPTPSDKPLTEGQDRHGDEKEASLQVQTSRFVNRVKDSIQAMRVASKLRNDTVRITTLETLFAKLESATNEFQGKL